MTAVAGMKVEKLSKLPVKNVKEKGTSGYSVDVPSKEVFDVIQKYGDRRNPWLKRKPKNS